MSGDDKKVRRLPVRPKNNERSLELADKHGGDCEHKRFVVDEREAEVRCSDCGEKLNAIWCLARLARAETDWFRFHERYVKEVKRLRERLRTKCQHCGKMTRISDR